MDNDPYLLENERFLNEAIQLFNDEKWDECATATGALMERDLSQWQHIYCLTLLAPCLEDWYKGEDHRYAAECLYENFRMLWPPGKSAALDADMDELRTILDQLREQHREERPDDYAENCEFKIDMYRKWSSIIDAEGEWRAELEAAAKEREAELAEGYEEEEAELAEGDMEREAEFAEGDIEALADQHDTFEDVLNVDDTTTLYQKADELIAAEQGLAKDSQEAFINKHQAEIEDKGERKPQDNTGESQQQLQVKDVQEPYVAGEYHAGAKSKGRPESQDHADEQPRPPQVRAYDRPGKGKQQALQLLGSHQHQHRAHVRNREVSLGQSSETNVAGRLFSGSHGAQHGDNKGASLRPEDALKRFQTRSSRSPGRNMPPSLKRKNSNIEFQNKASGDRSPAREGSMGSMPVRPKTTNKRRSIMGFFGGGRQGDNEAESRDK